MARRPGEPRGHEALVILAMVAVVLIALVAVFFHSGFLQRPGAQATLELASMGPTDGLERKSFRVVNASEGLAWPKLAILLDGKAIEYADLVSTTPGYCVELSPGSRCVDPSTFGAASLALHPGQVLVVRGDPMISQTVDVRLRDPDASLWSAKAAD